MTSQRVSKFIEHQNETATFYEYHAPPPPPYTERDELLLSPPPVLSPQRISGCNSVQHSRYSKGLPPSPYDISRDGKHRTRHHISNMLQQFRQYMVNRRANRREKRPQDGKTNPFE